MNGERCLSPAEREERALKALEKARSTLVLEHPFFGSLALRMRLCCDGSCADLWADGRTLACNPAYALAVSEKVLLGSLTHEVLHIALGHHVRRKGRDERLWNRACNYAVNAVLLEAGFSLPDGALFRPEYAGRSADDIYSWLARLQDGPSHRAKVTKEEGDEISLAAEGSQGLGGEKGRENRASSAAPRKGEKGSGTEKGGTGRRKPEGRERGAEGSFSGEVRDHPLLKEGMGDEAREKAEQEADTALAQASREALRMGDMPASLTRLVKKRLHPVLSWRDMLARFLEQCSDNDYTWAQPHRRYVHEGLYLPSRREARLASVALAVDASGSVDAELLSRFCTELSGLLSDFDATLFVLYHDVRVNACAVYTRADMPFTPVPVGGGGTDYRPVPERLEEEGMLPSCLLWFTDLECDRFPEEPPYPVLWIVPEQPRVLPPFGETVVMPPAGFPA
ncbi:VWA-like domain-containing protein [uncultured Mailhella sp.]|uniref:vWA domain-containing protein n=1 Tax=uncultured Mailhella sp. TaxID=1981031 RepID=UPI0025E6089A|nr:VWA-like domain-containing protein [uncultured Mailhella sp.]